MRRFLERVLKMQIGGPLSLWERVGVRAKCDSTVFPPCGPHPRPLSQRERGVSQNPFLPLALVALGLLLAPALLSGPRLAEADDPPGKNADKETPSEDTNPLGANAACYVCHMLFVREELSKVHLHGKVGCIKCHGLSAGHANDEDIGATKPDIMYKRDQVDAMCAKCHEEHDVPAVAVIGRWRERNLSANPPVCTDCHGTHKIERPEETEK